jgi:multidrug efflux pump subunit AcrA (membrane-fusion protein)
METYGRSLQEQRARRQQQIEDLMATNEQAANRRGIAGQLGPYTQPGSHVQPSRRQAPVDFHPSQGTAHSLADYLNPLRNHSTPIQEDDGWVQDNLARAQRPVNWEEQAMR